MYDSNKGQPQDYVTAMARMIDSNLDREKEEKLCYILDTRAGTGWPNPYVWNMLPFTSAFISVMTANFPERVDRVVVFPVPFLCRAFYAACRPFIAAKTQDKIVL